MVQWTPLMIFTAIKICLYKIFCAWWQPKPSAQPCRAAEPLSSCRNWMPLAANRNAMLFLLLHESDGSSVDSLPNSAHRLVGIPWQQR